MKLSEHVELIIAPEKLRDYLLNEVHFDGRHKAAFFRRFGVTGWRMLEPILRDHAAMHDVVTEENSPFGRRYVVEGIMHMPDGRSPAMRTVWFQRTDEAVVRFVTAYPLKVTPSEYEP